MVAKLSLVIVNDYRCLRLPLVRSTATTVAFTLSVLIWRCSLKVLTTVNVRQSNSYATLTTGTTRNISGKTKSALRMRHLKDPHTVIYPIRGQLCCPSMAQRLERTWLKPSYWPRRSSTEPSAMDLERNVTRATKPASIALEFNSRDRKCFPTYIMRYGRVY